MTRSPLRRSALVLACALALSTAACGSDKGSDAGTDSKADASTSTAAPADQGDGGSTDDGGSEGTDDGGAGAGTCLPDSNELSGSSTVVWQDGDVPAERTMTFQADGSLEPSTLTVAVDEQFAIDHGEGTGLRAVKVGCAGAQTVPTGVVAGFVINEPGTYTIIDEAADGYAGAEVGSVTVE